MNRRVIPRLTATRTTFGISDLSLAPPIRYDFPVLPPRLPDGVTVAQQTLNLFV